MSHWICCDLQESHAWNIYKRTSIGLCILCGPRNNFSFVLGAYFIVFQECLAIRVNVIWACKVHHRGQFSIPITTQFKSCDINLVSEWKKYSGPKFRWYGLEIPYGVGHDSPWELRQCAVSLELWIEHHGSSIFWATDQSIHTDALLKLTWKCIWYNDCLPNVYPSTLFRWPALNMALLGSLLDLMTVTRLDWICTNSKMELLMERWLFFFTFTGLTIKPISSLCSVCL